MLGVKLTLGCILFAALAQAELTPADREAIKQLLGGELVLRDTVPCRFTAGYAGIGAGILTEVSPTEVNWDRNLKSVGTQRTGGRRRRVIDTVYWGFGPNDRIHYGKIYFRKDGIVDLWAEGVEPKYLEIRIRFVNIVTMDDFRKAFDRVLSTRPLEDAATDWPVEIRRAVADRRVVKGMTKAQAFAVVGTPVALELREEAGHHIECWFPRQDTGTAGSYDKIVSATTGFPASLRFVDGRLAEIVPSAGQIRVDLDR